MLSAVLYSTAAVAAQQPDRLRFSVPGGTNNASGAQIFDCSRSGGNLDCPVTSDFTDDILLEEIEFGGTTFSASAGEIVPGAASRVIDEDVSGSVNAEYGDDDDDSDGDDDPFSKSGNPGADQESTDPSIRDPAIQAAFSNLSVSEGVDGEGQNYTLRFAFDKGVIDNDPGPDNQPEVIFFERGLNSDTRIQLITGGTFENPELSDVLVISRGELIDSGISIDTVEIGGGQALGVVGVDLSEFSGGGFDPATDAVFGMDFGSAGGGADLFGGIAAICKDNCVAQIFSPLAEYRMDEATWNGTSGEVEDSSGNGHDGTARNGASPQGSDPAISGDPGTCGYGTFDGNDEYVEVGTLSDMLSGTATLTFWIHTTQTGNDTGWMAPGVTGIEEEGGADDIFWGWLDGSGRIGISVGNDFDADQKSSSAINDGTWHHVALTRDANTGDTRVYVDGVLETSGNTGTGIIGNGFSSIGRIEDTGGTPEHFDGRLDELRIYDEVLEEESVRAVRDSTHPCPSFCAPGAAFSESFEDSTIDPWTTRGGPPFLAGVNQDTADDGSHSLFTRGGEIFVESPVVDLSAASTAALSLWVRRGDDEFSEDPDGGEDLEIQYKDASNNWQTLATFAGGGTPGEIFEPSFALPADAFHGDFQLRFHQLDGNRSGGGPNATFFDYWHMDSICLTAVIGGLDHYAIGHDGTAVTCGAEAVTITGHDGGDNPIDPGNVTIDLTTNTGEGTWARVLAGSGTLADATAGDGAASYTFPGNGEASVTLAFNYTTVSEATDPEIVNFNVDGGNEGAGEDPDLVVSRSGFRITDGSGNATTVPEQIAGKPSDEAPGAVSLALQAVRASDNDPSLCEPFFPDGGDVEVELGGECNDPGSCDGTSLEVTNNGNTAAVVTSDDNGGTGTASYTPMILRFGPDAEAPLVLEYDDAGRIQFHARYNIPLDDGTPSGNFMTGASNAYTVRPFGFEVDVPADDNTTGAGGTILAVAGDDFDTTVRAVAWQAGDDGDDDGQPDPGADLSGNATTTNFGNEASPETVTLTPVVAAPAGGSDGALSGALFDTFGSGSETQGVSWSEVGHVHLDASLSDGSYLGGSNATGRADTVGRFIPADFLVTVADDGDLAATCNAVFTYTGETAGYATNMEPQLLVTARNRATATTTNYRGAYAKLTAGDVSVAAPTEDASQLGADGTSNVSVGATIDTGTRVINGDGTVTYTFAGSDGFTYDKNANARIDGFTPDLDLAVTAVDDGEVGAAAPLPTVEPTATHEIRFGRLAIDAAAGSELAPIGQPVRAEVWNNGTWQTHADDDCTTLVLADEVQLDNGGTTVSGDQSIAVGGGTTDLVSNTPDPVALAGGRATLTFAAPGSGNTGFVDTTLRLGATLPWLQGDWDDADGAEDGPFDDDPTARVTFGIFSGNPNWIHLRRVR